MAPLVHPLPAELFDQKQKNLFCDVTLVATADGTGIPVHRCVLYAASEYFKKLLTADMKEKGLEEISLNGVSGAVLRQLIDYVYTREIDIDAANVQDILVAADRFLLDDVVDMCKHFYLESINVASVFHMLAVAAKYRLVELEQRSRDFACDHFLDIAANEAFMGLEVGTLVELLGSDDIQVDTEENVFNAIVKWIEADPEERKQHYAALMKTVRISKIDLKFLSTRIQEFSTKIGLLDVYSEACVDKINQVQKVTDFERKSRHKSIFAVGALQNGGGLQIERYSIATNAWEDVRLIPEMRTAQIHCIDDCLYLFEDGGDKVVCIPLSTMELETREPMKNVGKYYASASVGQYVYCFGGGIMKDNRAIQSVMRYDTKIDEWVDMAKLIQGRCEAAAAALAGKIYAVGGYGKGYLKSVECYDTETNKWSNVAEMNVARRDHRCCTINGLIYAVGGYVNTGRLASIEKYDPLLDQWTIVEINLDVPRSFFGIAAIADWIYIAGGRTGTREPPSKDVRKINVFDGRMEKLPSMRHERGNVHVAIAP